MNVVQECRKSLGLTQTKFGRKLGVSEDVISRLERGVTKLSTDLLFKMNNLAASGVKNKKPTKKISR